MALKQILRFPSGIMTPPPSKSLCHRALICAALASFGGAKRMSNLYNMGNSEDISATRNCIAALGAQWDEPNEAGVLRMLPGRKPLARHMDCGESASTLRFLLPIAALEKESIVFTGRKNLLQRPLDAYAPVFHDSGVRFSREAGRVSVCGPLRGGDYTLPGDRSSQYISGLLFALPLVAENSSVALIRPLESRGYVEMTLNMLRRFDIDVTHSQAYSRFFIPGGQRYQAADCHIEPDYSQAAFFLVAAALGRDVQCRGLAPHSLQGDRAILELLRDAGADVIRSGDLTSVHAERLHAIHVDARDIPDLIPPIAALCCFLEGISRIDNAGRLRLKESDRLHALAQELRNLGADIRADGDSLTIHGKKTLPGGKADAHGDHRIAMAIATAAIRCEGRVQLAGWESVNKSYPTFWNDFEGGN